MYIFKSTKRRANQYARYVDEQGTQYPQVPMELLEEIPDPARGNDELEYTQELDDAPYIVITPKPPEMVAAQNKAKVQAELNALELSQLMPRVTREFLLAATVLQAKSLGITEANLLDPEHAAYSPGFKKMWDFNQQTIELRAKLK